MCAAHLSGQPGSASAGAGSRCYSNTSAVGIVFLLLGWRQQGHTRGGWERDSISL